MKKIKEKLSKYLAPITARTSKWNWDKIFTRFQHTLFAIAMISIVLPAILHLLNGKFDATDGMRLIAGIWIFNAWSWWTALNKKRKEFTKLLIDNLDLHKELLEQSIANKVLVEVLNKIDKKVLAEHGISIKVEKPGRTVN